MKGGASPGGAGGAIVIESGTGATGTHGTVTVKAGSHTAVLIDALGNTADVGDDEAFTLKRPTQTTGNSSQQF